MSHPLRDVHAFTIHHYEREKKIEEKASHAIAEVYRLEIQNSDRSNPKGNWKRIVGTPWDSAPRADPRGWEPSNRRKIYVTWQGHWAVLIVNRLASATF
jgi:hypothetical protein